MPNTTSALLDRIPADTSDGTGSIPLGRVGVVNGVGSAVAVTAVLAGLDVSGLDDDAVLVAMVDCERIIAAAHAVQLRGLARLRELRAGYEEFVPDEVAPELAWTRNATAERVALAVGLTERTPVVLEALESGRIDLRKARIFCEDTTALTDEQARDAADRVLPRADQQNPTAFRRAVRRAVLRVDPDGQARRHDVARKDRRVVMYPLPDGMAGLTATLPAEQATAIYHHIDTLARTEHATGDERSADARRADVFTALLLGQTTTGSGSVGLRPLVQVTIAASTLAGADDLPGELAGHGPIPAAIARHIATDPTGTWRRLVTDPVDGSLLDYGRRTYRPPAALADHVRARDLTCRFPGCHQRADRADLDHTVPYPKGPTTADNLTALCRTHHRLKHQTGWTVTQHDGQLAWRSPAGRTYTTQPETQGPPQPTTRQLEPGEGTPCPTRSLRAQDEAIAGPQPGADGVSGTRRIRCGGARTGRRG